MLWPLISFTSPLVANVVAECLACATSCVICSSKVTNLASVSVLLGKRIWIIIS